MHGHVRHIQHLPRAEAVPRITDAVVPQGDICARLPKLFNSGERRYDPEG